MYFRARIDRITINGIEVKGFESFTCEMLGPAEDPSDAETPKFTYADRDEEFSQADADAGSDPASDHRAAPGRVP